MIGRYITGGLAAALVAATTIAWVQWERASAARAREQAMAQQYASCVLAVDHQAAALEQWRRAALEAARLASEAERLAAEVRVEYRDRVRVIERDAPPPDTSCAEAVAWAATQYEALMAGWPQ